MATARLKLYAAFVVATTAGKAEEMFSDGSFGPACDVSDLALSLFGEVDLSNIPPSGPGRDPAGFPPDTLKQRSDRASLHGPGGYEVYRLLDGTEVIDVQQTLNDLQIERDDLIEEMSTVRASRDAALRERDELIEFKNKAYDEGLEAVKTRLADEARASEITIKFKIDLSEAQAEVDRLLAELETAKEIIKLNEEEEARAEVRAAEAQQRVAWEASQKTLDDERRARFAAPLIIDVVPGNKSPPSGSGQDPTGLPPTRQGDMKDEGDGPVDPEPTPSPTPTGRRSVNEEINAILRTDWPANVPVQDIIARIRREVVGAPPWSSDSRRIAMHASRIGVSRADARAMKGSAGQKPAADRAPRQPHVAPSRSVTLRREPYPDATPPRSKLYNEYGHRARDLMREGYGAEDIADELSKGLPKTQQVTLAQAIKLTLEIKRIDSEKGT